MCGREGRKEGGKSLFTIIDVYVLYILVYNTCTLYNLLYIIITYMFIYVYMLRTDYQPSDRFKTVRTALKPSGWF